MDVSASGWEALVKYKPVLNSYEDCVAHAHKTMAHGRRHTGDCRDVFRVADARTKSGMVGSVQKKKGYVPLRYDHICLVLGVFSGTRHLKVGEEYLTNRIRRRDSL